MQFVFDSAKHELDRAKHVVSLALAEVLFDGKHVKLADDRFAYGEKRMIAFGKVGLSVFACVFTDRGVPRRIISLRKANSREVKRYGNAL